MNCLPNVWYFFSGIALILLTSHKALFIGLTAMHLLRKPKPSSGRDRGPQMFGVLRKVARET